ncbi:MAG: hypothetical protein JSS82_02575 [Bacteroidetes bacterium]|nr:hypothetical protein [Bacteroidota bacterium]
MGSSHPTQENSGENNDLRETEGAKDEGNPQPSSHQEGQYDKQSTKPMQDK